MLLEMHVVAVTTSRAHIPGQTGASPDPLLDL